MPRSFRVLVWSPLRELPSRSRSGVGEQVDERDTQARATARRFRTELFRPPRPTLPMKVLYNVYRSASSAWVNPATSLPRRT
ncbi:MAG: hypothetical protein JWO38_4645 [Gemmataceae bacterium]|nr:hypothetical protein [Gemmataceae bacterium]